MDTLSSCVPEYYGNISTETLRFEATISERWPLGKPEIIAINASVTMDEYFRRVFTYLYNGTIILFNICPENRQKQLMIRIKQSVCLVTELGHPYVLSVVFIPAMSQACYDALQTIQHYRENASYLIHKESKYNNDGGIIKTEYFGPWSTKFRQYQVVLRVLKRRKKAVYMNIDHMWERNCHLAPCTMGFVWLLYHRL